MTGANDRQVDPRRRAAEGRGRRSEALAALYLRLKGYRVLARRFRTPVGEIVVRRGRTIVFVEVKNRPSADEAIEAVGLRARKRIARAGSYWLSSQPAAAQFDLRFDLVIILPRRWPRHLVAVFDSTGAA
jgi:putative endonuclease